MTNVKPADMNWVMPYLIVEDAEESMAFYRDVFGFEITLQVPDDHGNTCHFEMRHHDSVMMCGVMPAEQDGVLTPKQGGFKSPSSLYVYVDDVDAFFEKIKTDEHVMVLEAPADMFWGDRMCRVLDLNNHVWAFGTWSGKAPELGQSAE